MSAPIFLDLEPLLRWSKDQHSNGAAFAMENKRLEGLERAGELSVHDARRIVARLPRRGLTAEQRASLPRDVLAALAEIAMRRPAGRSWISSRRMINEMSQCFPSGEGGWRLGPFQFALYDLGDSIRAAHARCGVCNGHGARVCPQCHGLPLGAPCAVCEDLGFIACTLTTTERP